MPLTATSTPSSNLQDEHTFLVSNGRWTMHGHLLHRDGLLQPIHGKVMVVWNQDEWFTMVGQLAVPRQPNSNDPVQPPITLQYRGRTGLASHQYTFMLQHSQLGQIEGEGWLLPDSIVQKFWILDDPERRTGLEQFYRVNGDRYHWACNLMTGRSLVCSLDATLERHP